MNSENESQVTMKDRSTANNKLKFFNTDERNALESIEFAQYIAFAPVVFQATIALRDLGILALVEKSGKDGIAADEIVRQTGLPVYGVRVLLEAGLGIGILIINDEKY